MKKSLLFLSFSMVTFLNFLAQTTSNLVVFAEDATPFYVIVNGIKQNVEPQTNVKITGLTNPANQVKVIFKNTSLPSLNQQVYFQEMGVEATMKITNTKNGYKLRYFGEVPLQTTPTVDNSQWVSSFHATEPTQNTGVGGITTTTVVEEVVTTTTTTPVNTNTNVNVGTNGMGTTTTTTVNGTNTNTNTTVGTTENVNFNTNMNVNGDGASTNMGVNTNVSSTTTGNTESVNIGMNVGGVGVNMNVNVSETGMGTNQNVNYNETNTVTTNTTSNTSTGNATNVGVNTGFGTTSTTGTGSVSTTTTTTTTTTSTGTNNTVNTNTNVGNTTTGTPVYYVDGYSGAVGCAMPQAKIDKIKSVIEAESFSEDKMNVAKQATKNKCLTTAQVIEIAELFSFEDEKLAFVKYAYAYTYDVDNYYEINSIFDFSGTKDEFNKFLSTK